MSTTEGQNKEKEAIKNQGEELVELLYTLLTVINGLVERNPKPTESDSKVESQSDNVFDEIASTLRHCRGLIREATEKVQGGISGKVL